LEAVRNGAGDRRVGVGSGPKIVHQASSGKKVIDTEDKHELSEVQPDGRIVTQTRRTTEHEEVNENEDPDEHPDQQDEVSRRHSSHRFAKTKDQDIVEFIADGVKVGQETRYQCETTEGERYGDPNAMAAADAANRDWDSLSMRIKRMRKNKQLLQRATQGPGAVTATVPTERKDVLTRRPLDFDHEEETRKVETSKWLEHHFGSESRSSRDSLDDDAPSFGPTTSFINVTMKSRPTTSTPKVTYRLLPLCLLLRTIATNTNTVAGAKLIYNSPQYLEWNQAQDQLEGFFSIKLQNFKLRIMPKRLNFGFSEG